MNEAERGLVHTGMYVAISVFKRIIAINELAEGLEKFCSASSPEKLLLQTPEKIEKFRKMDAELLSLNHENFEGYNTVIGIQFFAFPDLRSFRDINQMYSQAVERFKRVYAQIEERVKMREKILR